MTRFGFESDLRIILTVRKLFEFNRAHINKLVNRSKLVGCYISVVVLSSRVMRTKRLNGRRTVQLFLPPQRCRVSIFCISAQHFSHYCALILAFCGVAQNFQNCDDIKTQSWFRLVTSSQRTSWVRYLLAMSELILFLFIFPKFLLILQLNFYWFYN